MQCGHTQASAAFAFERLKFLVNGGANEVVNIASTKMMKKLFAGSVSIRHCEERLRRSNPVFLCGPWIASLRSQ
jgi:hypothetical protein